MEARGARFSGKARSCDGKGIERRRDFEIEIEAGRAKDSHPVGSDSGGRGRHRPRMSEGLGLDAMSGEGNGKYSLDGFLEACGAPGPLMLEYERGDGGDRGRRRRRMVPQPFALVGTGVRTDVPLSDSGVARRHLYLQALGGRVFAMDLTGETGRTRWAGAPRGEGWVSRGTPLELGEHRLWLSEDWGRGGGGGSGSEGDGARDPFEAVVDPLAQIGRDEAEPTLAAPRAVIEVRDDRGDVKSRWRINRVIALVGSAPRCHVRFHYDEIAAHHCALVLTPGGVWVVDLAGKEGTLALNGWASRAMRFDPGDTLKLGRFEIGLRYESAPASIGMKSVNQRAGASVSEIPAAAAGVAALEAPARLEALLERITRMAILPSEIAAPLSVAGAVANAGTVEPGSNPDSEGSATTPGVDAILMAQQSRMCQVFGEFQRVVLDAASVLQTLKRDQDASLREELREIRRLSEELRETQAEWNARSGSGAWEAGLEAAPAALPVPAPVSAPVSLPAPAGRAGGPGSTPIPFIPAGRIRGVRESESVRAAGAPKDSIPVPGPRIALGSSASSSNMPMPMPMSTTVAIGPGRGGNPGETIPMDAPQEPADIGLFHRIDTLQRERESRLQRLLNRITGA